MAYDKQKYIQEQKEKTELLKQQVKEVANNFTRNPSDIAEFLSFRSKFYNYSYQNTMLIYKQNRGASFCGSFQSWKDKGYSVKQGETGIKIFVPVITTLYQENENAEWKRISDASKDEKEKIKKGEFKTRKITTFKIGSVFDIAQTTCPAEDYPKLFDMGYSSKQHAQITQGLINYSEQILNCSVSTEDVKSISLRGYYAPIENKIVLSDKLNDTEKLSTLSHELGHALLHNDIHSDKGTIQKELEADAVSIMIQSNYDVELTDSRKGHLADHFQALKEYNSNLPENEEKITLDNILKNASDIYNENIEDIKHFVDKEVEKVINNDKTYVAILEEKNNLETVSINDFKPPYVEIIWSENAELKDGEILSIKDAQETFLRLDTAMLEKDYYDKTKFEIVLDERGNTYQGRQDFGDGDGGIINHIESFRDNDLLCLKENGLISETEYAKRVSVYNNLIKELWDSYDNESINAISKELQKNPDNSELQKKLNTHLKCFRDRQIAFDFKGSAEQFNNITPEMKELWNSKIKKTTNPILNYCKSKSISPTPTIDFSNELEK